MTIIWDGQKWSTNIGGKEVVGLHECLNAYGAHGWELVNVIPWNGVLVGAKFETGWRPNNTWATTSITAFFKSRTE